MRTFTLLLGLALVPVVGCASSSPVRHTNPSEPTTVPKTHRMPSLFQRRAAHNIEESKTVAGQTRIEGVLTR